MNSLLTELCALMVYGPLLVLLHEAGHAMFASWGGFRVTSFGIGVGRPIWSVRLAHGVVVHVDRWFLGGGACVAIPSRPGSMRRAWFHAGGLIVQAMLALVLMLLPDWWWVARVEHFNLLVALTNAMPWRVQGSASDGWYLLDTFFGRPRPSEFISQRTALRRLAERQHAVGSHVGRVYAEVCLAWIDVLTGRSEDAAWFFTQDPPETAVDPWIDALYHYVHAEWHRTERRPLASLRMIRDTRNAIGSDMGDNADAMLTIAEARALVAAGAPGKAQRVLARIAGVGGPIGRQASAIQLAAVLDGPIDELEFSVWRVTRRVDEIWLDPADTASLLWSAADRLESHNKVAASLGARDAARRLARRAVDLCATEDRSWLAERIGPAAGSQAMADQASEAGR